MSSRGRAKVASPASPREERLELDEETTRDLDEGVAEIEAGDVVDGAPLLARLRNAKPRTARR